MSANIEPQVSTKPPRPKVIARVPADQAIWPRSKQSRERQEGQQDPGQQGRKVRGVLTAKTIFNGIDFRPTDSNRFNVPRYLSSRTARRM